jgi:RNA recognition motif-containing protein
LSKLYVGNLAHETTEGQLRAAFANFGEVSSIKIVSDRRGRTKGFAYIEMGDGDSATAAMESLRGTQINGRTMDIVEDTASARRGGGGHAGRGKRRR